MGKIQKTKAEVMKPKVEIQVNNAKVTVRGSKESSTMLQRRIGLASETLNSLKQ